MQDPSTAGRDEVVASLGSDLSRGLSATEAAHRLARDGANRLRRLPPPSRWQRLGAALRDPLVLLLLVAAAVSLAAWIAEGRYGWPMDTIVIAVVLVLNIGIGALQQARARSAVAALEDLTVATCGVVRDGLPSRVPSATLVRGDLLLLAEGDAVGADARLVEAAGLCLLEASLTGESEPVRKEVAPLPAPAALGDRLNMVFKGTSVVQGSGRAVVTAVGMDSEVGTVATLLDATVEVATPMQLEVARIGRVLGVAAVVIAGLVVTTILLTSPVRGSGDVVQALLLGVALAVAAVPEGLPAILSVVLSLGVQRMAARHAIVKRLASVETLGAASVIATDKTGTLTLAEMSIVRIVTASGTSDVDGVGYAPVGQVVLDGVELSAGAQRDEVAAVLAGGRLAGNASLRQSARGTWEVQGDPTEAAFLVAELKLAAAAQPVGRFTRVGELPFTSDRKMMSTVNLDRHADDAPTLVSKGAPGVLLARCDRVRIGRTAMPLDDAARLRILAEVAALADEGLRTLAVAYRPLEAGEDPQDHGALEQRLVYAGSVGITDPPRAGVADAIRQAQAAGLRVIMITGDHPRTALRIAADLGIDGAPGGAVAQALTGPQLDALAARGDAVLRQAVRTTAVYARVAPRHKLQIVRALQAGGDVVAMTGDGVNDAPALKAADIGIAMGPAGTAVAKEAARMILADDNFATIVQAVREGRGVLDNIRKFLRYLLSSNLGEVLTVFGGVAGAGLIGLAPAAGADAPLVLPLLATQILWINLITDTGPALAMGVDPIAGDTMARPPRARGHRLVDARMWTGIVTTGTVTALLALATLDLFLPGGLIEGDAELEQARTAAFTVLVLAQLFNCFNARSETRSAFRGLFANRWLWATVVLSAGLQVAVVHLEFLNRAFGTAALSPAQWMVCVAMASGVLWCGELRKAVLRRRAPASSRAA